MDEIHPRLRFAHRGLVALANNGERDSNDSQFIITLGSFVEHDVSPRNCVPTDAVLKIGLTSFTESIRSSDVALAIRSSASHSYSFRGCDD